MDHLDIKTKDLDANMVQEFYIIDKDLIGESLQFNLQMDKITAGLLEEFQSFDQVIAFNNNIIAEVTDHYLTNQLKRLEDNQQKRFQEDYKKWFLETQIGEEYPMGPPKSKQQEEQPMQQPQVAQEEIVEEQIVS